VVRKLEAVALRKPKAQALRKLEAVALRKPEWSAHVGKFQKYISILDDTSTNKSFVAHLVGTIKR
jgi:hypothetical protein